MKKYFLIIFITLFNFSLEASIKKDIIQNLESIENISFNFEQNITGKIENGVCTIKYPKKIFCKYNSKNEKVLVSNGKALVIKTKNSYYIYPLKKTPLNYILDKNFLINRISNLDERIIDNKFINFNFIENENEINIFFDKKNYNLIGWQTLDIYQNLSITFLSNIIKNQKLKRDMFFLPNQN